jgi:hypothetical protein
MGLGGRTSRQERRPSRLSPLRRIRRCPQRPGLGPLAVDRLGFHNFAMAHVLVACEISAEEPARRRDLRKALREQLRGYSWARAIRDVYVVELDSAEERRTLKTRLLDLAQSETGVRFIMTPLIGQGAYGGWLPKERWPKIRLRTGQPWEEQEAREGKPVAREKGSVGAAIAPTARKSTLLAAGSLFAPLAGLALTLTLKKRSRKKHRRIKRSRLLRLPHPF